MSEVVCFFPGKGGVGVILALEEGELGKLERRFKSKNLTVEYGFDFESQTPFIKLEDILIHLPSVILESFYYNPKLYIYSLVEDKVSIYVGTVEIDPIKIIRLDSVGKVSSELFNTFVPVTSAKLHTAFSSEEKETTSEEEAFYKGSN
ncbi:MAG: hypothetical protein QW607_09755 [Desulfurococcaceae archaeon]